MKHVLFAVVFGMAMTVCLTQQAAAQMSGEQSPAARALNGASGPGNAGVPNGSSGEIGRNSNAGADVPGGGAADMPALKPVQVPRQRLDAGALLCHTEAQLKQHQAAIMARLAGREAPEAGGCHIVGETIAVSVVSQDGPAAVQVQTAGDTPALGWTDAVIRDSDPMHSPLH